jgi:deoxyxylulose-5-phosphate synthase
VRIGGSRLAHEGDDVAIIACGITVDEAGQGRRALAGGGVRARVLDAYSIKPIDAEAVRAAARELRRDRHRRGPLAEGGLGDAASTPLGRPATTTPTSSSSPCARCPPRARLRSSCTRPDRRGRDRGRGAEAGRAPPEA